MEMLEGDEVALTPREATATTTTTTTTAAAPAPAAAASGGGGGGGAAWKSSAFTVLNEIQQAAAEAAEEIQKNVSLMTVCLLLTQSVVRLSAGRVAIKMARMVSMVR
jgi:hypothetical protein